MKFILLSFFVFALVSLSFASDYVYCTASYSKTFLITDCHKIVDFEFENGDAFCDNWIDVVGKEAFVQSNIYSDKKLCEYELEKIYSEARDSFPIQIVNSDRYNTTAFSR